MADNRQTARGGARAGFGWAGYAGRTSLTRRRADRVRVASEPLRQGGQIWRNKRYRLRGEAAERALIAAMAGRRVLGRSLVVVDLDAELGGIAKERLKLGGDRRVIGAGESGRGYRRRCRSGEKLNDKRKRDEKRGPGRAPSDRAPFPRRVPSANFRRPRPTKTSLRCAYSVTEGVRERNSSPFLRSASDNDHGR